MNNINANCIQKTNGGFMKTNYIQLIKIVCLSVGLTSSTQAQRESISKSAKASTAKLKAVAHKVVADPAAAASSLARSTKDKAKKVVNTVNTLVGSVV